MKDFYVKCVKDVIMDNGEIAFIRGNIYLMKNKSDFFIVKNEQGCQHYFDDFGADDYSQWFDLVQEL